jgi:hypothetical protein
MAVRLPAFGTAALYPPRRYEDLGKAQSSGIRRQVERQNDNIKIDLWEILL